MRLIDADELIEQMRAEAEADTDTSQVAMAAKSVVLMTCAVIEKQPTIDPVKHGHWIELSSYKFKICGEVDALKRELGRNRWDGLRLKCSYCGKTTMVDASIGYNYCPHCGARMEIGDEE